ncbi:MAG: hypothetical protein JW967_07135 [Dehalococcoidales bacterium]|nr:hypothetical protein [Dehalococcoidales bacterium]
MDELKLAILIVVILVGIYVVMLLGDYFGYKFGRMRLALYGGYVTLGLIILFAIYAAINLLVLN